MEKSLVQPIKWIKNIRYKKENELFAKRGYFMLISLFIFYYAGMGYEYLIYIIYKKNTGIIISKKSIIHTPQSERTRFAEVYMLYTLQYMSMRCITCIRFQ